MMNANFNLQAAAEQASKNYHASMAQLGLNTPIPESVRATAEKIVVRPAAKANPRPASTEQILELLEAAW